MRIPEETIQRIREANDIVDVVSEFVSLRKVGKNFVGLCPFHSEKTPSFSVVPDKQFFYCFGCHTGGDVIKFLMDIQGHTYLEAVKELAEKAGIPLPQIEEKYNDELFAKKERMRKAHDFACKLYHYVLLHTPYGEKARDYLNRRGFSRETMERFRLGYAPPQRNFLAKFLNRRGYDMDEMVEAGLLAFNAEQKTYTDRFVNRVLFPIEDAQGRVVAFGGRVLGAGQPKYLNSPESPIFQKSGQLFNLARAKRHIRKLGQAILFEGYADVVQCVQGGLENAVASLGTSFTEEMARILRRYASEVILCFDGDEAGQGSALRAAESLQRAGLAVRVAKVPDGLDPDDYIRKFGIDQFRSRVLKHSLPITAFRLERLRKGRDLSDPQERSRYVEEALEQVALLDSAIERDHYITLLADEFHLPAEVLRQETQKIKRKQRQNEKMRVRSVNQWNTNINNGTHTAHPNHLRPAYFNAERKLLALMLRDREVSRQVMEELGDSFNEPEHVAIAAEIYACAGEEVANMATAVLHRLNDPALQNIVTSLIMEETAEPINEKGLRELIRCILSYPKQKELEEMIQSRQEALENEDFERARHLDKKIRELQGQLKSFVMYKPKTV